ncbi:MAG: (d)CMP kinase [Clostridia bacterium]|nr:(d)CMP kinase [Clostridia bacterium]
MINIAIDGPSGAGKSTLAKQIAGARGYIYVDTGALYRAIGLYAKRIGITLDEPGKICDHLDEITIELRHEDGVQKVYLNGEDVGGLIRTQEISAYASAVSAQPPVREFLLDLQRDIAKKNDVVMDGRDIGTVILPDAQVKIFLTASDEGRAARRFKELTDKGIETTFEKVLEEMRERDKNDSSRTIAPLVPAPDAVLFDNTSYGMEEQLEKALEIIDGKLAGD